MIEVPDLRGNVLTGRHAEQLHALAVARVEALLGRLVDDLALLGVGPLLVPALSVARRHLHLLPCPRKWIGHRGTRVFASKLELPGEGNKLGRSHEIVTNILTQVITEKNEV